MPLADIAARGNTCSWCGEECTDAKAHLDHLAKCPRQPRRRARLTRRPMSCWRCAFEMDPSSACPRCGWLYVAPRKDP